MRRVAPHVPLVLVLSLLAACSYDYSRVPLVDAGPPGVDAGGPGPGLACDPIAASPGGCTGGRYCSAYLDPSGTPRVTCAFGGGTGASGAPCVGTGECAPPLFCISTAAGSASCQEVCTSDGRACTAPRYCDTSRALVTSAGVSAYRCALP
jgi:hypothetical protein